MKTEYVAGFLVDPDMSKVALIKKLKPDWQAGKLNAIGGKVEVSDSNDAIGAGTSTAHAAQRREFREETGADVERWTHYTTLFTPEAKIHFFIAVEDYAIHTAEKEEVGWYALSEVLVGRVASYELLPNVAPLLYLGLRYFVGDANPLKYTLHVR